MLHTIFFKFLMQTLLQGEHGGGKILPLLALHKGLIKEKYFFPKEVQIFKPPIPPKSWTSFMNGP